MSKENSLPDTDYWRLYQGRSYGLLKWEEVDAFWSSLAENATGWFVYDLEADPPSAQLSPDAFQFLLKDAETLVNQRRQDSHSGAIYVDDRESPAYIKVFDPYKMGTSCGGGHEMILPRYIISKTQPDRKPEPAPPKKGFLGRLILAK